MRRLAAGLAAMAALACAGCHSAFVDATVTNGTGQPVSLVEVDYPSASFGVETLAAGQVYHYRFKVQGSGATTLTYTDAAHAEHKGKGPVLHEGDEGLLAVTIGPGAVAWNTTFRQR